MINRGDKVIAMKDILYGNVFVIVGSEGIVTDYDAHGSGHIEVLWTDGELTCARLGHNTEEVRPDIKAASKENCIEIIVDS